MVKSTDFDVRLSWSLIPALLLPSYVTLNTPPTTSEPHRTVVKLNEIIYVKNLAQYLVHNRYSISDSFCYYFY